MRVSAELWDERDVSIIMVTRNRGKNAVVSNCLVLSYAQVLDAHTVRMGHLGKSIE